MTSQFDQYWDGLYWYDYAKFTMTYDANNNQTSTMSEGLFMGDWVIDYKAIYTYDANNKVITYVYQLGNGNVLENSDMATYTYNTNNNITKVLQYSWNGNSWANFSKYNYEYDANNNCITILGQGWNGSNWQNGELISNNYDANNNLRAELRQDWNDAWVNNTFKTYTYDSNNNKITELSQNWSWTGIWDNYWHILYTYDSNNNKISELGLRWNNNIWATNYQYLYLYDANNFLEGKSYKGWDNAGISLLSSDSSHYYFNAIVGIQDAKKVDDNISIYPNPAIDKIAIKTPSINKDITISIYNLQGQLLFQQSARHEKTEIDVSAFLKGMYFVRVETDEGMVCGKFVKE